jgi:hypothetical protein
VVPVLVGVLLVGGACSSAKPEVAVPASTTAPTGAPTTSAPSTAAPTSPPAPCRGLGQVAAGGDLTWLADGKLMDRAGCLVETAGGLGAWGGTADRVVLGDGVRFAGAAAPAPVGAGPVVLSRPTGKSVLRVTGAGKLLKREIGGGEWRDISFLGRHEAAVYHPAGRHIVSTGTDGDGKAAMVITDNEGRDPQPLLTIEAATSVGNPAFTASGALLYTADHTGHVDLHRLEIGDDKISTVTSVKAPGTIGNVVTSPFSGGGVAWTIGQCAPGSSATLKAQRGGTFFPLDGTEADTARPVGWLPDGRLAAIAGQGCDAAKPGKLLLVGADKVEVVAEAVTAAAVRAVLPPPPPPPAIIPPQGVA